MDSKAPSVRASAARTLLDRVGVPVVKEVRASVSARGFDLSKLSTEELLSLDRITEKARTEEQKERLSRMLAAKEPRCAASATPVFIHVSIPA